MSDRNLITETLNRLPYDLTLEEMREELDILIAVRESRKASAEGRVVTLDEAKQRAMTWNSKSS
jgi:hypothetical protein